MRSNEPSAKGRRVASPFTAVADICGGASPESCMASKTPTVSTSSGTAMSQATTRAPRRSASKAWRPKPQPEVEQTIAGPQAQSVVVGGEHQDRPLVAGAPTPGRRYRGALPAPPGRRIWTCAVSARRAR